MTRDSETDVNVENAEEISMDDVIGNIPEIPQEVNNAESAVNVLRKLEDSGRVNYENKHGFANFDDTNKRYYKITAKIKEGGVDKRDPDTVYPDGLHIVCFPYGKEKYYIRMTLREFRRTFHYSQNDDDWFLRYYYNPLTKECVSVSDYGKYASKNNLVEKRGCNLCYLNKKQEDGEKEVFDKYIKPVLDAEAEFRAAVTLTICEVYKERLGPEQILDKIDVICENFYKTREEVVAEWASQQGGKFTFGV
jgi:hypothetical protein